jgi:hypothetical protein
MTYDSRKIFVPSRRVSISRLPRGVGGRARREADTRPAYSLDPVGHIEMPQMLKWLVACSGERVLYLGPKLCAVGLTRNGVGATAVDAYARATDTCLRAAVRNLEPQAGHLPGERLPWISVIEHVPDDGDGAAQAELVRVVKPDGRVVMTMRYAESNYHEVRQTRKLCSDDAAEDDGQAAAEHFFCPWNDRARLERVLASVPMLEVTPMDVARLRSRRDQAAYDRCFRWVVLLGLLYRSSSATAPAATATSCASP